MKLIKKVFENRGYTSEFLEGLAVCNHTLPKNVPDLCFSLKEYHDEQKLLVLFTDFDFDGLNCSIVGFAGLVELGFQVAIYLPDVSSGYGFGPSDVDAILEQYPTACGILTGDVGISMFEGIAHARELGLDVFLTDHHSPSVNTNGEVEVPAANVIVNPRCDEPSYGSFGAICGANVMYQVLRYYAEHHTGILSGFYIEQIDRLRVFAGFGTISDSMPLYNENRRLVRDCVSICRMIYNDGLDSMLSHFSGTDTYRMVFFGLHWLLCHFAEAGKITTSEDIDEQFIAYYISPTFNSIKRMDGIVTDAYGIFFGGEQESDACISRLFELNQQRKDLVAEKLEDIMTQKQPYAPYLYITDAPGGICGLLAQNILTSTGLPTFVVAKQEDGSYKGSGRCPEWFPFLQLGLDNKQRWWAAGHDVAFGFGLNDRKTIRTFIKTLESRIDKVKPTDDELEFKPDFFVSSFGDGDMTIDIDELSHYVYDLERYRPFGNGFPMPKGKLKFRPQGAVWSVIGKEQNHVKVQLPDGLVILLFFHAPYFSGVTKKDKYDRLMIDADMLPEQIEVLGNFSFNEYKDTKTLQFLGDVTTASIIEDGLCEERSVDE